MPIISNHKTSITWIGQAGFIIENSEGRRLGVDLYLSDCVERVEGHCGYHRLVPAPECDYQNLDVLICSHFHRDHFDVDSIPLIMSNGYARLYCPEDCVEDIESSQIDKSRVQIIRPGDQVLQCGFDLTFVRCDHGLGSPKAVGVVIQTDGKRVLFIGDSCLHLDWKDEYLNQGPIDVLIAPINGAYGNLNEEDNVLLTAALAPKLSIPCHFGMFASHGGNPGLWKELLDNQLPEQKYLFLTVGESIMV